MSEKKKKEGDATGYIHVDTIEADVHRDASQPQRQKPSRPAAARNVEDTIEKVISHSRKEAEQKMKQTTHEELCGCHDCFMSFATKMKISAKELQIVVHDFIKRRKNTHMIPCKSSECMCAKHLKERESRGRSHTHEYFNNLKLNKGTSRSNNKEDLKSSKCSKSKKLNSSR